MARLYTSKRGRSGSTRPVSKKPPAWLKYTPEEIENLVIKLAREGHPASMIGTILRDRHGIPLVKYATGRSVTEILRQAGLASRIPEDLEALLRKADNLRKHLEKNRKDYSNKRSLALVESKIHRLARYYRDRGLLEAGWKYKTIVASTT